jgi:hypothetical protein
MPAIEYGTFYWGVILHGNGGAQSIGETVHLHADQMRIDENGALVFTSAGRRAAGTNPDQGKDDGKEQAGAQHGAAPASEKKDEKDEKKNAAADGEKNMIYVAFAPGSWKAVYAAKLQDGQPASIEHWTSFDGKHQLDEMVSANSGAAGVP